VSITDEFLTNLPDNPGVYLFRNSEKEIVYVGKAKSLKDRVRSYFREGNKESKTQRLLRVADDIEVILTGNEKEAFLLENNLIKEHRPRYNVVLKDDKSYVSLKLTVRDRFPMLTLTRTIKDDGALYFGPYPHAREVRDILKMIQSLYPIRRCRDTVFKKRTRACMLFQVGKCPGPCIHEVDDKVYRGMVDELVDFLSGRDEKLLRGLEEEIEAAAGAWRFEEAREKKERYLAIKRLTEKQYVHEHLGRNRDVWAFLAEEGRIKIVLLSFREGLLISKRLFKPSSAAGFGDAISSFLFQYYSTRPIPDEVILSEELDDLTFLESYLREKKRRRVAVHGPTHPRSRDLIGLAVENLQEVEEISPSEAFKGVLRLRKRPERIEVYDISHSHGTNPSGIMAVFQDFKAKKEAYRVFHIREAGSEDDVAMMGEVLRRRLKDDKIRPLPDLIVLDGGKGQLSAAVTALRGAGLAIDLLGIAKGEKRKRMEDIIYLPFRKNPLPLPKSSPVFKEIVKMRDEAHRFAITSHKKWKRRDDLSSRLHRIKGVGKKRMTALMKEFPSLEAMKEAGVDGISRLPGFNRTVAEAVVEAL
jgi:excinuclease ABC subunit C